MEYYIYVTKACNYTCTYCDVIDKAKQSPAGMGPPSVRKTVEYILSDRTCCNTEKVLVFYGGEPLLNSDFIRECLHLTANSGIKYLLCTNGSLLCKADAAILQKIHYFFVSIDGDEIIHDRHRGGTGSFDLVVRNVLDLKRRFNGATMARITLPIVSDASLYTAVMGVIDKFDYVYCQVENNEKMYSASLLRKFKQNFDRDLGKLTEYWIKNIKRGVVRNIIPFQTIISSLLFNRVSNDLPRCGCGTSIVYCDTDGRCYMCDKLIGKEEFSAGNWLDGTSWCYKRKCTELRKCCIGCGIRSICGGRCLPQLLYYPDHKFEFYCDIQKIAVNKIVQNVPEIMQLISSGAIEQQALDIEAHPIAKCTELIF